MMMRTHVSITYITPDLTRARFDHFPSNEHLLHKYNLLIQAELFMCVPQSAVVYTIEWIGLNSHVRTCYQLAPINFCRQVQIAQAHLPKKSMNCVKVVNDEGRNGRCFLSAADEERYRNRNVTDDLDALYGTIFR